MFNFFRVFCVFRGVFLYVTFEIEASPGYCAELLLFTFFQILSLVRDDNMKGGSLALLTLHRNSAAHPLN